MENSYPQDQRIEKKIPSSLEAEKYILGSMLIDSVLALDICTSLNANDFYYQPHKEIIKAIHSLAADRKEITAIGVIEVLKREGTYDKVGGTNYIFELIDEVPVISEVDTYLEVIHDKAIQRTLLEAVRTINDKILAGETELDTLLDETEESVMNIIKRRTSSSFISMDRATEKTFEIIERKISQIDEQDKVVTGYSEIDEVIHGLNRGSLIIIAARPSIGKSTFALNIAQNVAEQNKKVAFFSLEMGYDQLVSKIFAATSAINMDKIISGDLNDNEMARLIVTKNKIAQYPIFFDDESNSELNDIKIKCQQLKREGLLDLIVIDYLQLLEVKGGSGGNRVQEVGKISRGLKVMARTLDVPIIALSQLSRDIERRDDKTPVLADLRESGSIEQDADIVMFLHRETSKKDEQTKSYRNSKTDVIIAKNRNGATDKIQLVFNGAHSKFSSMYEAEDK